MPYFCPVAVYILNQISILAIVLSLTDKDLPGTGSSVMDGYIQQLPDELGPQPMSEMFTLLNVCVDDCGCNLHGCHLIFNILYEYS